MIAAEIDEIIAREKADCFLQIQVSPKLAFRALQKTIAMSQIGTLTSANN